MLDDYVEDNTQAGVHAEQTNFFSSEFICSSEPCSDQTPRPHLELP